MSIHDDHAHSCGGCCGHDVKNVPVEAVSGDPSGFSRRNFLMGLGTAAVGAWAMQSRSAGAAGERRLVNDSLPPTRKLVVQPVLLCHTAQHRDKTSWRSWGGVQTDDAIKQEMQRIAAETAKLQKTADFPLEILPVVEVRNNEQAAKVLEKDYDTTLIYAAGGGLGTLEKLISPTRTAVIFMRHRSGPVYLWYEILHPRFLRKTVDELGDTGVDVHDVVVDEYDDVLWRLRSLYGLKNAWGERILAIGDASGWGAGGRKAPAIARDKWHMEIIPYSYDDLGKRFKKLTADSKRVAECRAQAADYLRKRGVTLETKTEHVENGFILAALIRDIMTEAGVRAMTINQCMGTVMQVTETTACLPLSLLNDQGYMAFCESDFVVIPSGVLLHHISGLPVFLNDPTTPHHGVVTLAHCTAPRKLDGRRLEKVTLKTHFESDFGASPAVHMRQGLITTNIDPDFAEKRWIGFRGKTIETPYMDICRSQVDVEIEGDWVKLLEEMRGFHWMFCYGDYMKEVGYACKKAGIEWVDVSKA